MKTKTKISLLFTALAAFFILFALGYFHIRAQEQNIYFESKQNSDNLVISTVLQFKMEGFLKPVKDNSAWDEMVAHNIAKDTVWIKDNLDPILSTFSMSYLGTFDLNGNLIYAVNDTTGSSFAISSQQIKELFSEKKSWNGYIFHDGQLYEIFGAALVPTFDIMRNTPPNGYMVGAKNWNASYCAEMEKATGFHLEIHRNDQPQLDQSNHDIEVNYHKFIELNNAKPGFIKFYRPNRLASELNSLGYFAIAGSLILILVCFVFFYWISRWVSKPLKQITQSLSSGEIGSVKDILEKQNEFGDIARLLRRFNAQQTDLINKIAEKNLADEQIRKLSTAVEQSANTIIITDTEGKIEYVNKRFTELTGFSSSEAIGQNPRLLKSGFQDDTFWKNLWETILSGNEWKGEIYNKKKNGDFFWESTSIAPIRNQEGKLVNFIAIKEDITERKQIETDLQKAKEDAEQANRAKSEFLATMSHEIRTPMNGVIGMTELALTTNLTSSQRDYLESIQTSAFLLLDTINNILDFSKIEAGRLEIEHVEFNIYDVLEKSVDILTVKAFEKNLELLCDIEPGLPEFYYGDPLRIRQILVNFISNAIKFTEKGEICISAKKHPDSSGQNDEISILFSVKDTGIGIAESNQEHIFDQFTQADNSTTRKYGGTGLGLSISRMLTLIMNGFLTVESQLGIGSTFSFVLPLKIATPKQALEPPKPDIKKVLVVDDNSTNLKIMKDMLNYWGIDSTVCSTGTKALEILQTASEAQLVYDLVIVDMHMPGMDGIAVAERIRDNQRLSQKPVIFMYSSVEKDNIYERCKNLGIDRYLTKPVKMKDFFDLLHIGAPQTHAKPSQYMLTNENTPVIDPGKTILIAEDNSINMKLLTVMLLKTGVRVISASNGNEAITQFTNNKVDLIFMDVHMPEKDGFQATQEIRKIENPGQRVPIIALTAIVMPGDREKCISAGMNDYLSKPFRKDDLFEIIRKYLIPETEEII